MNYSDYLRNLWEAIRTLGWAWSCLWNVVYFGRVDETVSARIGWSIKQGGFWSRVWLPGWFRRHLERAMRWKVTWE